MHFVVRENIKDALSVLQEVGKKLLILCSNNQIKLSIDKCQLLLNMQQQNVLKIGNFNIKNSYFEKLIAINFDCKLKLSSHTEDICKKASHKLNTLSRIVPNIDQSKRRTLMNASLRRSLINVP